MAGGKQTPRQKMINMMYLVLTAMLALNVSKDILEALTKLDDSLAATVETVDKKNAAIYGQFAAAAAENADKAGPWRDKALEVKKSSDDLFKYIESVKSELVERTGGEDENGNPKALDNKEKAANYLLVEGKATELKKEIDAFRVDMLAHAEDNEQLQEYIKTVFSTESVKVGDNKATWESATFEHFPLGAILPFLTDFQAKVRNTESDVITDLQRHIGGSDIKVSTVRPIVIPNSTYITQGDEYVAQISLAAYDETAQPEIYVNGEMLAPENVQNGIGTYRIKASATGEMKWGGKIVLPQMGGDRTFDIPEQSFRVAPPSVVISPTKMNVLYRGVDNPLDIGVPGVDPSKIRVSGPGVSGSNGSYSANVTNVKGKDVTISVSVVEEDGSSRSAGSKQFRIKGIPQAEGQIYKRSEGRFSHKAVANATIEAGFTDFVFELPLTVTSFEVAVPGAPPEQVKGNSIPGGVKQKIMSLKPGSTVTIRDIKAKGPKGVIVPRISPIVVDVQ